MKKYTFFECNAQISQLQARLQKNGYLSKGSLPNSSDAKIFLLFERLKKIPQRTTHPNLYHWYILMKQFSLRTVQIWQQLDATDEDKFINQFIAHWTKPVLKENKSAFSNSSKQSFLNQGSSKIIAQQSSPSNSGKWLKNQEFGQTPLSRSNILPISLKIISPQGIALPPYSKTELNSSPFDIQYVMQMQLKQNSCRMSMLKQRLQFQKLQLITCEAEENSIRVVFRAEAEECERLKDRISQWKEISNLRFRKQKRFNTKSQNKSEKIILSRDLSISIAAN